MLKDFRYYAGSENKAAETIEADVIKISGIYKTTVAINAYLLTSCITSFPCGDGDDYTLTREETLKALETLQEGRRQLLERYPVKTFQGWRESGLPTFKDYCKPGDKVDEEMVDYFVNSVPPVTLRSDCTQSGEPFSSEADPETGKYRQTYGTFVRLTSSLWRFEGYCFIGQTTNKVKAKTSLERRIEELRGGIKNV